MSAGDTTQGRRRDDGTQPHELAPGEYALASPDARVVWLCSPDGKPGHVSSPLWTITVEDDETVTVDPSIFWDKDASPPDNRAEDSWTCMRRLADEVNWRLRTPARRAGTGTYSTASGERPR